MIYLYCCWYTPVGPRTMLYSGKKHILCKDEFEKSRDIVVSDITKETGQILPMGFKNSCVLQYFSPVPDDVASDIINSA